MQTAVKPEQWDMVIDGSSSLFDLKIKEVWRYRDLLLMFVKRDFVSFYKQTILGPLWFFIQPLFTTIVFTFIFGNLAGLSTDGLPQPLFYLAGITAWIVEIGELDSSFKKDVARLKGFLTRESDKLRPAYGKVTIHHPRRTVFAAPGQMPHHQAPGTHRPQGGFGRRVAQ